MIKEMIYVLILFLAVPAGGFLAWLCNDELVKDRKYLIALGIFLLLAFAFISLLGSFTAKISIILSLIFMILAVLVMIGLSYNKKFVRIL